MDLDEQIDTSAAAEAHKMFHETYAHCLVTLSNGSRVMMVDERTAKSICKWNINRGAKLVLDDLSRDILKR